MWLTGQCGSTFGLWLASPAEGCPSGSRAQRSAGLVFKSSYPGTRCVSWLNPSRVSVGVWVSIPAPPTLFCYAVTV
jgi:hypothetical protein